MPLRETQFADSHRKSPVWLLQFGLSPPPCLLIAENPQPPDSYGFQITLRENNQYIVPCTTLPRDVEREHWRRQLALSAITASWSWHPSPHGRLVALLKIYTWKRTEFTVTAVSRYSGDPLRSLNPGAHV